MCRTLLSTSRHLIPELTLFSIGRSSNRILKKILILWVWGSWSALSTETDDSPSMMCRVSATSQRSCRCQDSFHFQIPFGSRGHKAVCSFYWKPSSISLKINTKDDTNSCKHSCARILKFAHTPKSNSSYKIAQVSPWTRLPWRPGLAHSKS